MDASCDNQTQKSLAQAYVNFIMVSGLLFLIYLASLFEFEIRQFLYATLYIIVIKKTKFLREKNPAMVYDNKTVTK